MPAIILAAGTTYAIAKQLNYEKDKTSPLPMLPADCPFDDVYWNDAIWERLEEGNI